MLRELSGPPSVPMVENGGDIQRMDVLSLVGRSSSSGRLRERKRAPLVCRDHPEGPRAREGKTHSDDIKTKEIQEVGYQYI